jgi:hypothetical protein
MIVVVKADEFKKRVVKILLYASLITMFGAYYIHTSKKMQELNEQASLKNNKNAFKPQSKEDKKAKKIEKFIYKEAQIIVDIIGQQYIKSCKVAKNRLVFIVDNNVSIEPMMVRYGANMLVKYEKYRTLTAVDVSFVLKNKYHEPVKKVVKKDMEE